MNIQIFGGGKNFDVKKAERYFKERRIPVQRVDLFEKGLSKGELRAVCRSLGSAEALVDPGARQRRPLFGFSTRRKRTGSSFCLNTPRLCGSPLCVTVPPRPWDSDRKYGKHGSKTIYPSQLQFSSRGRVRVSITASSPSRRQSSSRRERGGSGFPSSSS